MVLPTNLTYDCLVVFHIRIEGGSSFLFVLDFISFNPPVPVSISLRGDMFNAFYFRFKVHLEPLLIVISVWSPASARVMKSAPVLIAIHVRR